MNGDVLVCDKLTVVTERHLNPEPEQVQLIETALIDTV
jgi:hypothetical protein